MDLPLVYMTCEESMWYNITGPHTSDQWESTEPEGYGYLGLGDERRLFALSMFHQNHCLNLIRYGLEGRYDDGTHKHIQHCLSYIRQMILCHPDLTLEPADILERDYNIHRIGATHLCKDWTKVYDMLKENWSSFQEKSG
jgi:hypothetical protein